MSTERVLLRNLWPRFYSVLIWNLIFLFSIVIRRKAKRKFSHDRHLLLYILGKNVSKYCLSTKHNSRASYHVMELSFLTQKFADLYPVRCDYWFYQIVKFEYGLAFSGVTFTPEFAKKKKKCQLVGWDTETNSRRINGELFSLYFRRRKERRLNWKLCVVWRKCLATTILRQAVIFPMWMVFWWNSGTGVELVYQWGLTVY